MFFLLFCFLIPFLPCWYRIFVSVCVCVRSKEHPHKEQRVAPTVSETCGGMCGISMRMTVISLPGNLSIRATSVLNLKPCGANNNKK